MVLTIKDVVEIEIKVFGYTGSWCERNHSRSICIPVTCVSIMLDVAILIGATSIWCIRHGRTRLRARPPVLTF
jgi:hypothetical protein